MKKKLFFIHVLYIFLFISGSVHGFGEKTLLLGGEASWKLAEFRSRITEAVSVRPHPVLIINSAADLTGYSAATGPLGIFSALTEPALDLYLSFDEREAGLFRDSTGQYRITVMPELEAVDSRYAKAGTGAALFFNSPGAGFQNTSTGIGAPLIIEPRSRNALFAPGNRIGDFSIEFWLHPLNMENGEEILSWISSIPVNNEFIFQQIKCTASRNRMLWSFTNFFISPDGVTRINVNFSGDTPIIPKTWSHHLIRFDATTGMVEYIINGRSEAIAYATPTGREGGNVYKPITGEGGAFFIGQKYMGLIDEFKIHNACINRSSYHKYAPAGGRMETRAVDLGGNTSSVIKVDASGGRTSIDGRRINNEFRENGRFRFSDDSEMQFFIRSSDNPYRLNDSSWVSFIPGAEIAGIIRGRYVQLAVDFYPSSDGLTTPYLDQLRITYLPGEPPLPPQVLTAAAVDGGVMLRWRNSPDANAAGYLVYYSSVRGELFGKEAVLGPSPIDAGNVNSLFIDGLANGTLYYFRVAAYDSIGRNVGEFSREVTARPLSGLTLSSF